MRSAAKIVVTVLWPLAAARVAMETQALLPGSNSTAVAALGAITFLAIASLNPLNIFAYGRPGISRHVIRESLIAVGAFAAAAALVSGPFDFVPLMVPLSILVAAAVEEWIFRFLLPLRLAACMAGSRVPERALRAGSVVLAQLAFVACHFVGANPDFDGFYAARLFSAGLLYAGVVATSGLGVAIAVHAALNLALFNTLEMSASGPTMVPFLLAGIVALMVMLVVYENGFLKAGRPNGPTTPIARERSRSPVPRLGERPAEIL